MRRKLVVGLLTALLAAAPAGSAFGQDTSESGDGESALDTLGAVLDEVAALFGGDGDTGDEVRTAVGDLLDDVLGTVEFVATAAAQSETEGEDDDAGDESESEDDGQHGEIVSTVAQCAPTGNTLRDLLDGLNNHGRFVSAAARGETVTVTVPVIGDVDGTPTVTDETEAEFDLSTVEGAESLCEATALVEQAAELESTVDDEDGDHPGRGKGNDRAEQARERGGGRPDHAGEPDGAGRPDHAGKPDGAGRPDHAGGPGDGEGADGDTERG